MSIGFFPKIYEDELVYSALARFYEKSGFLSYIDAAEELYVKKTCRPSFEFLNLLKPELVEKLSNSVGSMEEVIKNHTMYQPYATFLSKEKREKAFEMLCRMEGIASELLRLPKIRDERFMRYCPLCVNEDREKHGEAYWHRKHQLMDCGYCLKHHIKLKNSAVKITSQQSRPLSTLESEAKDLDMEGDCEADNQSDFLTYLDKILWSDTEIENVRKVIDSHLRISNYTKGTLINTKELFDDYRKYYGNEALIKEKWKIEEILKGNVFNPVMVCQLTYFLGINQFKELPYENNTEAKILRLMKEMPEANYNEVARRLFISRNTVERVCKKNNITAHYKKRQKDKRALDEKIMRERVIWLKAVEEHPEKSYREIRSLSAYSYTFVFLRREDRAWTEKHYPRGTKKNGRKTENWQELDMMFLPRVKGLIEEMKLQEGRPIRVVRSYICRELGISVQKFKKMPCCNETILQNTETYPEYWGREVRWAIAFLREQNIIPTISGIKKLTSLTRGKIERCKTFLDTETAELLSKL